MRLVLQLAPNMSEAEPLLPLPATDDRTRRHTRNTPLVGIAFLVLVGSAVAWFLSLHALKEDDTPDFSRLPPPQPGIRNPNYVESGRNGAVASEVDVCSRIGVEGKHWPRRPRVTHPGATETDACSFHSAQGGRNCC